MASRPAKQITDQLRQAIDDSGLTRYQIAKETGIDEMPWRSFTTGQGGFRWKV